MGGGVSYCERWVNVTPGRGGTKQGNTLQSATRGFLKRERKDEERSKSEGGTGGRGRRMGETEEITVHEINKESTRKVNLAQSMELRV